MDPEASVSSPMELERMLTDERTEPKQLQLTLLKSITNNFSVDLEIGTGGFAVVYKVCSLSTILSRSHFI